MTKYDETYDIIVAMAKAKMLMNSHKGDIENLSTEDLVAQGRAEFGELFDAVKGDQGYMPVVEEAADVLNFTVAAAHNAIEKYRKRK